MQTFQDLLGEVTQTLTGWGEAFFAKLPHLVLAAVLLGVSVYIGRLARNGLAKALDHSNLPPTLKGLAERLAQVGVVALAVLIALGLLDLEKPLTSLLAGAGVAGLAIGFAFQHATANFISSVTLAMRRPFGVGDIVDLGGHMGRVVQTDLRVTHLETFQGQEVRIPNKTVIENTIVNYSTGQRRVDIEVGVGYGSDLEQVVRLTEEAASDVCGRLEDKDVRVFFTGFGGSSIDLVVQIWVDSHKQPSFLAARSDAIMRIKAAYDEAGIEIPFPIRTLDVGDALSELRDADLLAAK